MSSAPLFTAGYLFQVLGSLLLVFACIVGLMYLLRRVTRLGGSGEVPLRVLGSANVGNRERVVLLSAGGEHILLGVAPGSVRTLHVFPEPVVAEQTAPAPADFSRILQALRAPGSGR